MINITKFVIISLFITYGLNAEAGVFRCIDKNNKVTYSDTPCNGSKSVESVNTNHNTLESANNYPSSSYGNNTKEGLNDDQYQSRKDEILSEIKQYEYKSGDSLGVSLEKKSHRNTLKLELEMLEREHLANINPNAASNQKLEKDVERLKQDSATQKSPSINSRNYTVYENGRTKFCQEFGNNVTCN